MGALRVKLLLLLLLCCDRIILNNVAFNMLFVLSLFSSCSSDCVCVGGGALRV